MKESVEWRRGREDHPTLATGWPKLGGLNAALPEPWGISMHLEKKLHPAERWRASLMHSRRCGVHIDRLFAQIGMTRRNGARFPA